MNQKKFNNNIIGTQKEDTPESTMQQGREIGRASCRERV